MRITQGKEYDLKFRNLSSESWFLRRALLHSVRNCDISAFFSSPARLTVPLVNAIRLRLLEVFEMFFFQNERE